MPSPEQIYQDSEHEPFAFGGRLGAPTALCVHGFTGTPAEMRPLATALNVQGWSVSCQALPGFGRDAENMSNVTHEAWLRVIRKQWKGMQGTEQTRVLIGFSMGGAIATILASEIEPDYLILIAPFTRLNSRLSPLIPVARFVKREHRPFADADFDDPKVRESLGKWDGLNLDDPAVQQAIRENITLPMSAVNELRTVGLMGLKVAENVNCPVLVVQGTEDPSVDFRTTRQLVTRLGGRVQYHEMAGDHHVARIPENVMPLIESFVTFCDDKGTKGAELD